MNFGSIDIQTQVLLGARQGCYLCYHNSSQQLKSSSGSPFQIVLGEDVAAVSDERRLELERLVGGIVGAVDRQVKDAVAGLGAPDVGHVFAGGQQAADDRIPLPTGSKLWSFRV